ncbi:hypothetical protein JZ751_020008 [Albula glossodonta]|uniref:Caspase family p20 domain-containing protein n=1 Tax=Albula glossodonta TaxID=121402 RepID=A0A8T2NMC6_9TELE|nr:hypothetical protein JZ751_020008 [Albula glossodonta]
MEDMCRNTVILFQQEEHKVQRSMGHLWTLLFTALYVIMCPILRSSVEVYRMQAEPRGTCVIIDCVGSDGDILKETFSRLHFRVLLHKWPSLEDIHCVLRGQARTQDLQGHDAFICCIISRATSSDLLATQQRGPGLSLDGIRQLFTAETCPGLAGKPKLFFIQSYGVSEPCGQYGYRDEDLETDSPATTCAVESIPTEADVFWSLCRTNEQQLQHSGHQSVYLRTLCAALLNGQRRKLHLVDVHTEVNAVIYDHNQELPGETYSVSLRHTLRKNLFM